MSERLFTVRLEESERSDGSKGWVGTTEEWPGVVVEAETKDAARSELMAVVSNLCKRVYGESAPGYIEWAAASPPQET